MIFESAAVEHQLATYMPANKTFIKKKQTKKRKADVALQPPPVLLTDITAESISLLVVTADTAADFTKCV